MHRILGIGCIILGICCLISSVGLIVYNQWEEERAQIASQIILQDIRENIQEIIPDNITDSVPESPPEEPVTQESIPEPTDTEALHPDESERDISPEITAEIPKEMLTAQVNGYDCIGILSIPVLDLELPVLTDWNYTKLKIAPCHYFGSCYETDFVIAAHNYRSQFGRLPELQPKDLILFTDISGTTHCYEVILTETLPANATKEMIASGFDLSLYTCTSAGTGRITVRCQKVE